MKRGVGGKKGLPFEKKVGQARHLKKVKNNKRFKNKRNEQEGAMRE